MVGLSATQFVSSSQITVLSQEYDTKLATTVERYEASTPALIPSVLTATIATFGLSTR